MRDWPFTPEVVLQIHAAILATSGGSTGIRDHGLLESALARPLAGYGEQDLYRNPIEKAAALAHAISRNHPFVDGNKRVATVLMIVLLRLHDLNFVASDHEAEEGILALAAGKLDLQAFTEWLHRHVK